MGKKKKVRDNDTTVFDAMIAQDIKENESSQKPSCNHFSRAIRLTRTVKFLSQSHKKNYVCKNCKSGEALWICLYCCNIGCGRYSNQHAFHHYQKDRAHHCISVSVVDDDLSFWCYMCDNDLIPDSSNPLLWECRIKLGKVLQVSDPKVEKESVVGESIQKPQTKNKSVIPGLVNLGNTCFFNSVMQCLFHSVKLGELIEDPTLEIASNTVLEAFSNGFRSVKKYIAMGQDTLNRSSGSSINPSDIFQKIARKWKVYSQFRQQDSHELLLRLLDLMDHESKTTMPNRPSLVKQAFGGELASLIVCDVCESVSISKEEYGVLSLSIPLDDGSLGEDTIDNLANKIQKLSILKSDRTKELLKDIAVHSSNKQITLLTCLEKFMEVEILDEENRRICDECKKKNPNGVSTDGDDTSHYPQSGSSKSFKRYLLYSTPPILVFHLKRFQSLGFFKTRKVDTHVEFDEYLETGPFLVPPTSSEGMPQNSKYQLYGLVVHGGSLLGGHYVSYVRHNTDEWFYCSDSHTRGASWDEVRKCQAYLLFYQLIS